MYQRVYIDIVFATNLLMDYFLLRIVGILLRCRTGRIRCAIAAVTGALFSCAVLYIPEGQVPPIASVLLNGFCALVMVKISYRIRQGSLLAKAFLMLYLTAFLCGGFWEALTEGRKITIGLFFLSAGCTYIGLGALTLIGDSVRAYRKKIYPVTLCYKEKKFSTYGFYDTGNLIRDPLNGQPVSVIDPEILRDLLTEELAERLKCFREKPEELKNTEIAGLKPHFLSCRTVGQREQLMLAVTLENLSIQTPRETVSVTAPVLAFAPEPFALGSEYKILINSSLLH